MRGCQLHTLEVIYEELGLTGNFHSVRISQIAIARKVSLTTTVT